MNKIKSKCIVFTGGGTGGHIYPGIAIADELKLLYKDNKYDTASLSIVWMGSSSGMDKSIIQKSGKSIDKFIGIPSGKLRRYFSFKNLIDVFKIFLGCLSALVSLIKIKPVAVFSKGGFVSVPPCYAAKILHIPVFTHECDYSPGLATRLNSKVATKILLSFSDTGKFFPQKYQSKLIVTGNPVRPVFYNADAKKGLAFLQKSFTNSEEVTKVFDKPILLILGGSSGARQINTLVTQNLNWLCSNFIVVHQMGAGNMPTFTNDNPKPLEYLPYEFIYDEMPDVIACADIVLSRAGSNSLWECAVLEKPLVLIPLSGGGTRGDQVENARFFQEKNAALVIDGQSADEDTLRNMLLKVLDSSVRKDLTDNIKKLKTIERPARKIAELLKGEIL